MRKRITYNATNVGVDTLVWDVGNTVPPGGVGVVWVAHFEDRAISIGDCCFVIECASEAVIGVLISRSNVQSIVGKTAILDAISRSSSIASKGIRSPHGRTKHVSTVCVLCFIPPAKEVQTLEWILLRPGRYSRNGTSVAALVTEKSLIDVHVVAVPGKELALVYLS